LTSENKSGTFIRPTALQCDRRKPHENRDDAMLGPLFSLFFLGCFWIAGSLALQELYDSRGDIRAALGGRGGVKRLPRASF
jgi:hypothetical protein